jgi:hypothetical protein
VKMLGVAYDLAGRFVWFLAMSVMALYLSVLAIHAAYSIPLDPEVRSTYEVVIVVAAIVGFALLAFCKVAHRLITGRGSMSDFASFIVARLATLALLTAVMVLGSYAWLFPDIEAGPERALLAAAGLALLAVLCFLGGTRPTRQTP